MSAFAAAGLFVVYSLIKFSGDKLFNQFYYVVPIIIPFVHFIFERFILFKQSSLTQKIVDFLVVMTAMWRVIGDVPHISGHSLFLTYAFLTGRTKTLKICSAVIIVEVTILKIFVWNDWLTLLNGMLIAAVAAFTHLRLARK